MPGLLLLRHAQSAWNADGRWQGWADPPLSAGGEQQTRRSAAYLRDEERFEVVVSSDLVRARRTVEVIVEVLDLVVPHRIETGLREYDVGDWSGCTLEQIEARWPGAPARFTSDVLFTPPGGESRAHFDDRVVAAGRRVGTEAAAQGLGRMLVVAHGGVVRSLARAAGLPDYRVGHLGGYRGWYTGGGLFPASRCNLVDESGERAQADAGEAGEGAMQPAR